MKHEHHHRHGYGRSEQRLVWRVWPLNESAFRRGGYLWTQPAATRRLNQQQSSVSGGSILSLSNANFLFQITPPPFSHKLRATSLSTRRLFSQSPRLFKMRPYEPHRRLTTHVGWTREKQTKDVKAAPWTTDRLFKTPDRKFDAFAAGVQIIWALKENEKIPSENLKTLWKH